MDDARGSSGGGWRLALPVAGIGVTIAIVWAAIVVVSLIGEVDSLPRSGIPGEVTIAVGEGQTGSYYVYYERHELFSTVPVEVDLAVEVTDPQGARVEVAQHSGLRNFRLFDRVGQVHASFEAAVTGTYTVSADQPAPHEQATLAVGPSVTGSLVRDLAGPLIVFVAALLAGAVALAVSRR